MYLVIKAALSEPLLAEKEKETTAEPAYILQSIHSYIGFDRRLSTIYVRVAVAVRFSVEIFSPKLI